MDSYRLSSTRTTEPVAVTPTSEGVGSGSWALPVDNWERELADPYCRSPRELASLLGNAPWRRFAVLGDSIAVGVGDPVPGYQDRSWVDRLAASLAGAGHHPRYLNVGVRELRAAEIRARQLDRCLHFRPDLAVVSAGPNDMLRRSFDTGVVGEELERIVGGLSSTGCLVVTFGLFDLSSTSFVPDSMRADLQDRIRRLNTVTRAITRRHDGVHVDFFDHPALDEGLFSADMIHPNRRAHAYIATAVVEALAARLASEGTCAAAHPE